MATAVSSKPHVVSLPGQPLLPSAEECFVDGLPLDHPTRLIEKKPYFASRHGAAYLGDSLELLRSLPSNSVNLVVTSPPYALHFKKAYGNEHKDRYVEWFLPFAREIQRVLTEDGSFVLNIGGSYNQGTPTRSILSLIHISSWSATSARTRRAGP